MKSLTFLSIMALLLVNKPVVGHDSPYQHNCPKPHLAIDYYDQEQLERLFKDIEKYQTCISEFVQKQAEESQIHTEAAMSGRSDVKQLGAELRRHMPEELLKSLEATVD